jgi:hypothetical protein
MEVRLELIERVSKDKWIARAKSTGVLYTVIKISCKNILTYNHFIEQY